MIDKELIISLLKIYYDVEEIRIHTLNNTLSIQMVLKKEIE